MHYFKMITFAASLLLMSAGILQAQDWQLKEKLHPDNLQAADNLGISIDISETHLISGAWWKDQDVNGSLMSSAGAAFIYILNDDGNWEEVQMLQSSAPEALGYFGFSVAIEGNIAVVGAYNEDSPDGSFGNTGSVYIYEQDPDGIWEQADKLIDPVPDNADYFGYNLSLSFPYLLVGAYREQEDVSEGNNLLNAGAAYIYQYQNGDWSLKQKLVADDRTADDEFGRYLDIDNQTVVIGANLKDHELISDQGAAYIFERNSSTDIWEQKQKLIAPDGSFFDDFGWSVSVDEDNIMVAASSEQMVPNGGILSNAGAVYCYEKEQTGNWELIQKLYAPDFSPADFFGRSLQIDGDRAVIGAETQNTDENNANSMEGAGAAYVFYKSENEWIFDQKLVGTNRQFNDLFGAAVAIHSPHIAVGAWLADGDEGFDAGAAYVYRNDMLSTGNSGIQHLDFPVSIYPNPSSDIMHLEVDENMMKSIILFDNRGTIISRFETRKELERFSGDLQSGMYQIVIYRNDGGIEVIKWVKVIN